MSEIEIYIKILSFAAIEFPEISIKEHGETTPSTVNDVLGILRYIKKNREAKGIYDEN
jgi:hypothetical protein